MYASKLIKIVLQLQEEAKNAERDSKIDELFEHLDSHSSGVVDMDFIECALALYKPTPLADAIAEGNRFMNCQSHSKSMSLKYALYLFK